MLGLMPPGGVEDITDFWFWLITNAYNSYGLVQAAALLKAIDHPRADEIARQAQEVHRSGPHEILPSHGNDPRSFDYGMEYFNLCSLVKLSAVDVGLGGSRSLRRRYPFIAM